MPDPTIDNPLVDSRGRGVAAKRVSEDVPAPQLIEL
jgi:hypothetical protein